ncbi:MAG: winged helix-turn-helix domain-containing protein [Candidatus Thermoplasmatota archaeon]
MEPGTITLDRESFKALASEVRVEILKQLEARRMTVTDLSHAMSLSKPTLLEHLDRLVTAGLVNKVDEGRKWIYYDLTKRGRSILHPHQVKIMISLALSVLLFSAGIVAVLAAFVAPAPMFGTGGSPAQDTATRFLGGESSVPEAIAAGAPGPWGLIAVLLAVIPLVIALVYHRAGRDLIASVRLQLGAP